METLVRLRDLGVKPYILANSLSGVISQKLVPRLCPGATEEMRPDAPVVDELKRIGVLEEDWSGTLHRGVEREGGPPGGEKGRVGVFEMLSISDDLRDMIDRAAPASDMEGHLSDDCFLSFRRYCRYLLAEGLVAPDRIVRLFPRR
jgi:type IV pilus assembly protein PilB